MKIQLGTLLVLTLLYSKEHVRALIWVIAGSIGFYAVKGGIFTLLTLGEHRVWGPPESFIFDNNSIALAAIISIPLWAYLYTQYKDRKYVRLGIAAAIVLSAVSAIGSQSRSRDCAWYSSDGHWPRWKLTRCSHSLAGRRCRATRAPEWQRAHIWANWSSNCSTVFSRRSMA